MMPYIRINGTEEYWRALDQNLSEAMIGRMTPQEALDRTAEAWKGITERRGLDLQLKQYQEAVGYEP
jgi:multiple sugar transport system substrate-binding protein